MSHIPVPPLCKLLAQSSKNIVVQCHTHHQENKSNNLKQEYIVLEFDIHVTMHCDRFLIIKPTRCNNFSNSFLEGNCAYFGQFLCPSSGSLHCTQLSANLYDIYHCCVYSEKLRMMDRGTVQNMQSFLPKMNLRSYCI